MAKKKKKRQQRPPGVDPNEKRRQRLEEKRRQREEAAKAQRRAAFRERLVRGMVIAALVVAAVWFFFLRNQTPSEIQGFEVSKFSESGVNNHVTGSVAYEMSPPVSGPHDQFAARCGVHGTQIENELFVHSLEHGAVGLLYDPEEVDEGTIGDLEALVGEYDDRTISAPSSEMGTPIAATSWGEMMRLPEYDESALREYVEAFRGKGPEDLPCENTEDQPFDPQASPEGPEGIDLEDLEDIEDGAEEDDQGDDAGDNEKDDDRNRERDRKEGSNDDS